MKKFLLFAGAVATIAAGSAYAQESVDLDQACQDNYYTTRSSNWFIEVGGGISVPAVENNSDGHRKITANYGGGFGKWFSPYFAWRMEFQGGAKHWNSSYGMGKFRAVNGNVDVMWDMFNSLGSVNSKRVFSIVPFLGMGATYAWDYRPKEASNVINRGDEVKRNEWLFPVSAGLQLRFRLSEYVDFFAQARASFYGDSFNNYVGHRPVDIDITCLGGFTFNLGGSRFKSFNPCNYTQYISTLNNQVNDLREELAGTAAALAVAQSQLPCPEVTNEVTVIEQAPLLSTVRFKINSARITDEEQVNVYNIAQWLNQNPDQNIVITGYADKDTGSSAYNMALSQRRAEAVYNMLVNDYGISSDRLATDAEGSDTQIYDVNNWNRIVVFSGAE